jgi:single-strand DNA-binding protein
MSVNYVHVQGRLVRDPELKTISTGSELCKFTVGTSEEYNGKKSSCFIDVTVWGSQASAISASCRKGSIVDVIGKLKQENWEKDGVRRTKHSIVAEIVNFAASVPQGNQEPRQSESAKAYAEPKKPTQEADDSEAPF